MDREHTEPRLGQELHVASQNHEQVKDVPGVAEVGPGAPTGPSPQDQLKGEEGVQAQLCNTETLNLMPYCLLGPGNNSTGQCSQMTHTPAQCSFTA